MPTAAYPSHLSDKEQAVPASISDTTRKIFFTSLSEIFKSNPPFPCQYTTVGGGGQGGEPMTVSTYYDGKLIGEPMTDLSGEALLQFIEMQMVLKREVRIAPEQAE